jgi:carboxypeptidase Taq
VLTSDPYDALMEQYDPGHRAADIAPVFGTEDFLLGPVPQALSFQEERLARRRSARSPPYPPTRQRELGLR